MKHILVLLLTMSVAACSNWVYKYDIAQGNYLNQDDVDKLRVDMNKEQVEYVLGSAVAQNPFNSNKWHYVYLLKSGKTDKTARRELIVEFIDGKLKDISGTYKKPEQFDIPLDAETNE